MGLHRAIQVAREGDLASLRALSATGCLSAAVTDAQGATPAHHAARCGQLDCLSFLVREAGLCCRARARNGATPAHDAAATGHVRELQWLLGHGECSIEERDSAGASALHLAARFGRTEVVQWLLSSGGGAEEETDSGALPVHYAAAGGHLTCLKLLLCQSPRCVNHQTRVGATPLYLACQEGHLHVVEYLVKDCGADVHLRAHDGMSALHAAAHMGHRALVIWLASFTDMNLSCQDRDGATAMHFAASEGHHRILERLLHVGAKVMRDQWGGTPLHDAAENGELECCRVLLTNQISPLDQDTDGFSAVDLAEYNGHHDCANYLRAADAGLHNSSGGYRRPEGILMEDEGREDVAVLGSPHSAHLHQGFREQSRCLIIGAGMECSKQPVKEVSPQPRFSPTPPPPLSLTSPSTTPVKAASGHIQHMQVASTVVTSFNMMRSPEEDKRLFSQMKSIKSMKHAGITAVFTGQTRGENALVMLPAEEANLADIDSLVPTHDESGRPIAEWKRQVMVRKLQARLQDEEDQRRKENGNRCVDMDSWRYSQVHNAILGPFGELLTEDDLVYLEEQIETVSLQKRCQAYELELARLADELRSILPAPIVNITVNTQFLQQQDTEAPLPLPMWCSRISGIVKSMSLLLTNLTDRAAGDESICRMPNTELASVFSQQPERQSSTRGRREKVEREIQQSGVSVRSLRSNFESQMGNIYPFAGIINNKPQQDMKQPHISISTNGKEQVLGVAGQAVDMNPITDSGKRRPSKEIAPVMETTSLRKERIVVLFLGHWKKSAYAITMRAKIKQGLDEQKAAENDQKTENSTVAQHGNGSIYHLYRQMNTVDKMIGNWRSIIADIPSRQIRSLNKKQVTYSPEQFLPHVDGAPVAYDTLTLDLFMLGYFHILEQELPAEERKMRHLLCFEVFDHVGMFPWERVRDFHKAVLQDVEAGRREWRDGFEDIKARFFGNAGRNPSLPGRSPMDCSECPSHETRIVPRVVVENATPDDGDVLRRSGDTDFSCFSNDDICKYIDRSFAFWKEKEADLFNF